MKKIGIMTTGGDCSGLNSVINRIITGAENRGWNVIGIIDGTDGLCRKPANIIELNNNILPPETVRLAGSLLHNGNACMMNFEKASKMNKLDTFNRMLKKSLTDLKLDALVIIGGNGSLSLSWKIAIYIQVYPWFVYRKQ